MKKLLLIAFFLCISIALMPNIGLSMKLTEIKNISDMDTPKVDTSKWITYPVGRYLIKLPPLTQIEGERDFKYNDSSLTWEKDLTIQEANSLLKNKYLDLVKKEWLNVEYTENFGAEGLGSLLSYSDKKNPDTSGPSSIKYEMYVVNNKPAFDPNFEQRVYSFRYRTVGGFESAFEFSPEEILNIQKKETDFIHMLANNIWPSDKALPLETRNGVYFEGGFVHTPSDFHKLVGTLLWSFNEETSITCTFYEYPHIKLSLYPRFFFDGSPVTKIKTEAENQSYTNIFGEASKDELCTFTQNDIKNYSFSSSTEGVLSNMIDEGVSFVLINMINEGVVFDTNDEGEETASSSIELDKPSFESDEAAVAVWNAIKENVRWRPDNWKVKAPDGPYFMVYEEIIPAIIPQ